MNQLLHLFILLRRGRCRGIWEEWVTEVGGCLGYPGQSAVITGSSGTHRVLDPEQRMPGGEWSGRELQDSTGAGRLPPSSLQNAPFSFYPHPNLSHL